MAVPKRKTSKCRRDLRNANKGLKARSFTACESCQEPIRSHAACSKCGFYKGSKVARTKADRNQQRAEKVEALEAKAKESKNISE